MRVPRATLNADVAPISYVREADKYLLTHHASGVVC